MTSERLYDPLWTNARALLDYLEGGGLINRDIATARIGQFVIASGDLSVLNAAGMAKTWVSTSLRDILLKTVENNTRAQFNTNPENAQLNPSDKEKTEQIVLDNAKNNALAALDNLQYYPHSITCTVTGNGISVWRFHCMKRA